MSKKLTMVSAIVQGKLVTKFVWLESNKDGNFRLNRGYIARAFRSLHVCYLATSASAVRRAYNEYKN